MICRSKNSGFTLIELIAVIVIIGILATIAVQKMAPVAESFKVEETRQEMDMLASAITGNPELHNNGTRSDFGYIGDIGSMPPNLDALKSNPGYSTWDGPYIGNDLEQIPNDYKRDAWQSDYVYSGGAVITSTGSGGNISRRLAGSTGELLYNGVSGNIFDLDGTPPGTDYVDSIAVRLAVPDGSGSIITKSTSTDAGGYFEFDSIPIGNHDLQLIYIPNNDTLRRFVSVRPNSDVYGEYYLASDLWNAEGGGGGAGTGLEWIDESDSLLTANCSRLSFCITNTTGSAITVTSMTITWISPTAYYRLVKWNGTTVRTGNPGLTSGDTATFSSLRTVDSGATACVEITEFHSNPGGGGTPVDMTGAAFDIEFSDGSAISFTADVCN